MANAIIFDGEGVVVDTESIWDRGQAEFLARRGYKYDRAVVKPLITGRSVVEGAAIMQDMYGFGGDPVELAKERIDIVRQLFETQAQFIPGFEEFFQQVSGRYRTCIATAMDPDLFRLIDKRLNVSNLFHNQIFFLSDVDFRSKPEPDLFLYAAKQLQAAPRECIVIEDAPHGIEAARRAGMKCVALATTYTTDRLSRADLVVHAFNELRPETLANLLNTTHKPR